MGLLNGSWFQRAYLCGKWHHKICTIKDYPLTWAFYLIQFCFGNPKQKLKASALYYPSDNAGYQTACKAYSYKWPQETCPHHILKKFGREREGDNPSGSALRNAIFIPTLKMWSVKQRLGYHRRLSWAVITKRCAWVYTQVIKTLINVFINVFVTWVWTQANLLVETGTLKKKNINHGQMFPFPILSLVVAIYDIAVMGDKFTLCIM